MTAGNPSPKSIRAPFAVCLTQSRIQHVFRRMGPSLVMVICDGPLFRSSRRPCGVSRRWLRWCVQVRLLARCTAARTCDHVITDSVSSFGETATHLVRSVPLPVSEPGIAGYTVITVDLDGRRKALRFLGVLAAFGLLMAGVSLINAFQHRN